MNLFFLIDLLLASAVLCSTYWISYYSGSIGWLVFGSGMFLLFRMGICMEYKRDKADNCDKRYALMLFDKKYSLELTVNLCLTLVCVFAGFNIWSAFFSGAMFHGAWVIALVHEWLWRMFSKYRYLLNRRQKKEPEIVED